MRLIYIYMLIHTHTHVYIHIYLYTQTSFPIPWTSSVTDLSKILNTYSRARVSKLFL